MDDRRAAILRDEATVAVRIEAGDVEADFADDLVGRTDLAAGGRRQQQRGGRSHLGLCSKVKLHGFNSSALGGGFSVTLRGGHTARNAVYPGSARRAGTISTGQGAALRTPEATLPTRSS